jgi:D-alanine-D-alanine ligase
VNFKKKYILIVLGGWSDERQVSIKSGQNVYRFLKNNNYKVEIFDLRKDNIFKIFQKKPDLIFNALHGEFGEDGTLSNLASKHNIPITHSDDLTSALCFDKRLTKDFLKTKINLDIPSEINFNHKIFYPIISKPFRGGSSNGVHLIENQKSLKKFINDKNLMFEEVIAGKELTVTVLNYKNKIIPLGITEIEFNSDIYDYKSKYTKNKSKHFLPARISKHQYEYLLDLSVKIFQTCGCRSIARLDFIQSKKNHKFYFLELNTHPGLTKISLAPEQANYQKISYLDLIENIIFSAI